MRFLVNLGLIGLVLGWSSTFCFQVDETEYAVVTRFGQPTRYLLDAGLQFKRPAPFETVLRFDNRLQVFETPAADRPSDEFLTRDKKNVVVGTYTAWRIAREPQAVSKFLQTVRDTTKAEVRLADLVLSELGATLGAHEFSALVTTRPADWKWPQIVRGVAERCRARARNDYGIELVDCQITRLSFPEQNRRSVFERMRAERERIAMQYRSEGEEEATKIRAAARGEEKRILSEAEEQTARIRGQADAEATRIYGEAYGVDPAFYEFTRTLELYGKALDEETILILSPENRFLRLLQQPPADDGPRAADKGAP